MSRNYDNWERLVAAVLKKEQLWQLFHQQSRSPSFCSDASDSSSSFDLRSPIHDVPFDLSWPGASSPPRRLLEDAVAQLRLLPKLVFVSDFSSDFDLEDVFRASSKLLGRGTFGSVFMASMDNGISIVVKRLNLVRISEQDFNQHMENVGEIRHENVVPLRAYFSSKDEKLMLYDHYYKGSVSALLHGKTGQKRDHVDWESRLRIAIGAAKGICHIHMQNGGKLVHGNIKSSNIFLTPQHSGCISDLGLANMIPATFMQTARCYAPEVKNTSNVSQASDVYSFGILLFELLTRKSPIQVTSGHKAVDLVKRVLSVKSKLWVAKVFDTDLLKNPSINEQMVKMLQVGIRCVAKSSKKRPQMTDVVRMLEDIRLVNTGNPVIDDFDKELWFLENDFPAFDLHEMLTASAEVLGRGTFGTSYFAELAKGNRLMIKRLKDVNVTKKEFQQHMEVIGRIRHENVSELRAYHNSKDEKLLVYDYINQDSVSALLHGKGRAGGTHLDWETRLKVAVGAARGIAYIHSQDGWKFVHGNIKTSNVFLNEQGYGCVSDVGLSKLVRPITASGIQPPVYRAPEFTDSRCVSQASDVYNFGVVLLELVYGKQIQVDADNGKAISLIRLIQSVAREEWIDPTFAAFFRTHENIEESILEMLNLAIYCVADAPEHRPKMTEVVKILHEIAGVGILSQPSIESRLEVMLEVEHPH